MTAPIVPEARKLIESFEGYHKALADGRCAPYLCSARVPTLGFGTTYYEDGRRVTLRDAPITKDRASGLLSLQLAKVYAPAVDSSVKVPMSGLMRGSLVSFSYNVGGAALRKSTLLRMVNQQRWAEVPRAFSMYRMGGGRVLAGLERRRKAEALMFMAGVKALQTGKVDSAPIPIGPPASQPVQAGAWGRFLQLFTGRAA
jgi:lysozyme